MRRLSALLFAALPLAACGGGSGGNTAAFENRSGQPGLGETVEMIQSEGSRNYERPDGTFDRADFRRVNLALCRRSVSDPAQEIAPANREPFCACLVDYLLQADDNQLRAMRSDRAYGRRANMIVLRACGPVIDGQPPDPMVAPEGEANSTR